MANNPKNTVEIQNPIRHSINSNRASHESNLTDVEEAQKLPQGVIGLLSSENDKSQVYQIHALNQGILVQLLS
jgi:hypothetical protein